MSKANPTLKNIQIETYGNIHKIIIQSEGDAMMAHNALVEVRTFIESLFEKSLKRIQK